MIEVQVYIPGESSPTDLAGLTAHITGCIALDVPVQIPDLFVFNDPKAGVRTEIAATG